MRFFSEIADYTFHLFRVFADFSKVQEEVEHCSGQSTDECIHLAEDVGLV
jgi:hypothetical protein